MMSKIHILEKEENNELKNKFYNIDEMYLPEVNFHGNSKDSFRVSMFTVFLNCFLSSENYDI